MHIVRHILRILLFAVFAIALLGAGTLLALYSPWIQDTLREAIVNKFKPADGNSISLDSFRLRPPLRLEAGGVCLVEQGDTMVSVRRLQADIALIPLLRGIARVETASVENGYYRIGSPDSAMYMTIRAERANISPAEIGLSDMSIDVGNAYLRQCRVDMLLNPDTTTTSSEISRDSTDMSILLHRLRVEDLRYTMRMLPTIDSLGITMADATLLDGAIMMGPQTINLQSLAGSGLSASYIAPDSATIASTPAIPDSENPSLPWTVRIRSIDFDNSNAIYTTRGVTAQPGMDFAYIAVDSLQLAVRDFYNQASTLAVPLQFSGTERCGLKLAAGGTLRVDSTSLRLDTFAISTPAHTVLGLDYMMGMGDMSDPDLPVNANAKGHIATADLRMMFPMFKPYLAGLPDSGIETDIYASGTMGQLDLHRLDIAMNGCVKLTAKGRIANPMVPQKMSADINMDGRITDAAPIARSFLDPQMMKTIRIPAMALAGNVWMREGSEAGGHMKAVTQKGTLALNGTFNYRAERYKAQADATDFPINAFLPLLGVGRVSASMSATGRGFDIMSETTTLNAHADISSAEYSGHTYTGITAEACIANGNAGIELASTDPDMLAHITAKGNLAGPQMKWEAYADAQLIDLKALKFAETENRLSASLRAKAAYEPKTGYFNADIDLDRLQMRTPTAEFNVDDVKAALHADSTVRADIMNRDLHATADIFCPLDTLLAGTDSISAEIDTIISRRRIDAQRLQRAIPHMLVKVRGGNNNMVNDILASSKTSIDSISLDFANEGSISMNGRITGIRTQSMRADTASVSLAQFGNNIFFNANVDNRPGTFDAFAHVAMSGMVMDNIAAVRMRQRNIAGETGYDIGLQASIADSLVKASIMPLDPVIGYKPWTVNAGNFISYNLTDKHVDANIRMNGDESAVELYTEHMDGTHSQEDLVLHIQDIHVQDWIALSPFAPPVKGDVSAMIRMNYNENRQLNGRGTVDMTKFYYGRERVADIHADADVSTSAGGMLTASADISFDGHRAITLRGALNDSTLTSPLNLDLSMINLPLSVANPFLGAETGKLKGTLNGSLDIAGTTESPTLDGWLALDSASVYLTMTATDYPVTADTVPVVSNYARLKDFAVYGVNGQPVAMNGTVDISNFASPEIDLTIRGRNVQLVNSRRAARGADIYGKAYIDVDATAAGNMDFLRIGASLKLLSGTNVTYVMPNAVETLQSKSTGEMVKFVNFNDSAAVAEADSVVLSGMAMALDATAIFEPAATISVDLSADGKNKVQLQPTGELSYSLTPMNEDGRLSGRLNINSGFARYSPPFMGEKLFRFDPESYVAFNGNMMNPTLNIKAVDVIKANVTQEGQNSRLVNFNVGLSVSGTLEQMKVAFDLTTDDDITVSNELQAMSPEQRANQAMNMLLYNVYSGPGTRGNAAIGGNALFSFLESRLNSWASNNIKGVDISFGIDQYNRTVDGNTSQTMSYSYQVSKSLFDDRFKIVVGGNYSTDANADENFSQNLINDISFEYFLNKAQTMYVRLFRHTGFESILEGEITKTGVGFVYKHKLNSLRDIFRRRKPVQTEIINETAE